MVKKSQFIPETLGQGLGCGFQKPRVWYGSKGGRQTGKKLAGPVPNDLSLHLAGPPAPGGLQ